MQGGCGKKILTKAKQFIRKDPPGFTLINHEYWPAKVQWKSNFDGKIAINFYTKNWVVGPKIFQELKTKEDSKVFHDSAEIKKRYNAIELYSLDSSRGQTKIISDQFECLYQNMNILKNCSLFVASEGGMCHLSRAMNVPTILWLGKTERQIPRLSTLHYYHHLNN